MILRRALLSILPSIIPLGNTSPQPITIPLTLLPTSGLLVSRGLSLDGAPVPTIVDTGSPFLTCASESYGGGGGGQEGGDEESIEQYGEDFLSVKWQKARVSVSQDLGTMKVGVISAGKNNNVNRNYLGLVYKDAVRPSFLEQTPFTSFELSYPRRTLKLSTSRANLPHPFYDFSSASSNAYFYATPLRSITVNGSPLTPPPGRPLVAVVDSGLSGLIVDEDCRRLLLPGCNLNRTDRIDLNLPNGDVWRVRRESFLEVETYELPWFDRDGGGERQRPLVVALGAAYLFDGTLRVCTETKTFDVTF